MKVAIFCSFRDLDERYTSATQEFVEKLAQTGHDVIFGGSNKGLMKLVADTAQKHGARVMAISVEHLRKSVRQESDEIIIAKDLGDRKSLFVKHADAFVILPGGLGTLDEIAEMMELKKHKLHEKKIIVFNIASYYEGLIMQLNRMEAEGFLPESVATYAMFVHTADEVLNELA